MRALTSKLDYQYVVFDMGPSLGPLNRTVLLGTDFFVTPMAADLFSLYALDNIYDWMNTWLRTYKRSVTELRKTHATELKQLDFVIPTTPPISQGYAGYTVQQYVSRTSGSEIRKVRAYDQYKKRIPARVKALMKWATSSVANPDLGVVPNMFSMVPLAQSAHAPIHTLSAADGLRGAQISQNAKYANQLMSIAHALANNIGLKAKR